MKEVKKYICEVCGTEYNEKQKCAQCEKSHKKIGNIKKARYLNVSQNAQGYPITVDIEFEDGCVVTYKR